ncbi:MAG: ATP-dependent helicase [Lachnospiraceae bacterium]|nr:ATP-dependent helicase [Lachnospiraceae bacterium]
MQASYNQPQKAAIKHFNGPMLVLAGPGSGKTRVITARTGYLIEKYGVAPENILVITFTRAAAEEMKKRFFDAFGEYHGVSFGTFHSIFFRILRYAYRFQASDIITEEERMMWMREMIGRMNLDIEDEGEFISGIFSEISAVKNERIDLTNYHAKNCGEDVFRQIYETYDEVLRRKNKIDFDDILVLCHELLSQRADILKLWQEKYRYILVDEFQDINCIQYEIVKMLAKPHNNLFVVGDDDQSIYQFRGAKPELMFRFRQDYVNAKQVLLPINYRCQGHIVETAGRLISHNKTRFAKEITANRKATVPVDVAEFDNVAEENATIIRKIQEYHAAGIPYGEMAVLFRTNMGPRMLLEKLMEYNIPFRMRDSIPNLYDHFIAKDILAYINIACGSRSRTDYLRIINRPKRYISRDALPDREVAFKQLITYYQDKDWMMERLMQMNYDFKMLKNMSPYGAVHYIRNGIGYEKFLQEYAEYRRMKSEELYEVLDELAESAKNYKTYDEWFEGIRAYGEKLKEQNAFQKNDGKHVALSTMHSAKGLEYQIVFIIDCNEGVVPHRKALLPEEIEEERRMFYVAMTRAKDYLHIYSAKERFEKQVSTSRFVGEVLFDAEAFRPGVEVVHKKYGEGKIRSVADGKMSIYFYKLKKDLLFDIRFAVANRIIEPK